MTSAALADCNGATSDSASKAKAKRTVFMKVAPSSKERHPQDRDFNPNGVTKYRPRMKDLRRAAISRCGKAAYEHLLQDDPAVLCPREQRALQRGTTAVASISTRAAFSTRRTTCTSAMAG